MCFALFACAFNLSMSGPLSATRFISAGELSRGLFRESLGLHAKPHRHRDRRVLRPVSAAHGGPAARASISAHAVTLAPAQMNRQVPRRQAKLTAARTASRPCGDRGLRPATRKRRDVTAFVALVIFLAGFLFIYRIVHSPFGEAQGDPRAARDLLGYKTDRYKLVAFVLWATLAGVAGHKAIVLQLASWPMSGEVLMTRRRPRHHLRADRRLLCHPVHAVQARYRGGMGAGGVIFVALSAAASSARSPTGCARL